MESIRHGYLPMVSRIDFVAIPHTFLSSCVWSGTLPTMDLCQVHADHTAVAIQLDWQERMHKKSHTHPSVLHEGAKIRAQHSAIALGATKVLPWQSDIEIQVHCINHVLHDALQKACPETRQQPKKPFINEEIWHLRRDKLQLRRRLKTARRQINLTCYVAFSIDGQELRTPVNNCSLNACSTLLLSCQYWFASKKPQD